MQIVTDVVDLAELTAVVRALEFPEFSLRQFLPEVTREDIRFRVVRTRRESRRVAPYRAFDAESPIGARPGVETRSGALPPISEKLPLTEGEQLELDALYRNMDRALVDQLFDDAATEARRVAGRLELARGEVLSTGQITIAENGLDLDTVDFGVPASHIVASAAAHSTPSTDVLGDLFNWRDEYVATNGFAPGAILTSTSVRNGWGRNEGFRQLSGSILGTPSRVSTSQITSVFEEYDLPPIFTYDRKAVGVDGVERRIIPEGTVIFLPPQGERLGNTQLGVTAEARRLASARAIANEDLAGMVAVTMISDDPVTTWTKVAAIGLPVLDNPDALMIADVTGP